MNGRLLAVLLVATATGIAGDWDFDRVVKRIESHYGVQRTRIPFMGLANFALKIKHPGGAGEFQLAVFQNMESARAYGDLIDRDRLMHEFSNHGLRPMVATRSRRDGQSTYVFATDMGKSAVVFIALFQRNEATIIKLKADSKMFFRVLSDPEKTAESMTADSDQ